MTPQTTLSARNAPMSWVSSGVGPAAKTLSAPVIEIFSSLQGEGLFVGRPQVFVRFAACHLACAYCDTPLTPAAQGAALTPVGHEGAAPVFVENPLTPEALMALLRPMLAATPHHSVSLTGGEPLLYGDFLRALLPVLRAHTPVYLETAGTHAEVLSDLLPWVDVIAMDIKLASATGQTSPVAAHARFLDVARRHPQTQTFVKLVVGPPPPEEEMAFIEAIVPPRGVPLVIQPVTRPDGSSASSAQTLQALQRRLARVFDDVRVIPQTHKLMGLA